LAVSGALDTNRAEARHLEAMKIFITWSGARSLAVAEALDKYLPLVVNAFKPWLSKRSIDKGANWRAELAAGLAGARAGIVCLTASNLEEPWILYEAGAIANAVPDKPLACTLLIDLKSSDLTGPLSQFQDTKPTHDDLLHMMQNLNSAAGAEGVKETQVEAAFELVWPKLKEQLDNLPKDETNGRPHRTDRELLEDILETVRGTQQDTAQLTRAEEGNTGGIYEILTKLKSLTSERNWLEAILTAEPRYRLADLAGRGKETTASELRSDEASTPPRPTLAQQIAAERAAENAKQELLAKQVRAIVEAQKAAEEASQRDKKKK
jgi:hypothetical protein